MNPQVIAISHWTSDQPRKNFGDAAILSIVGALGYPYEIVKDFATKLPAGCEFILVGIGSVLNTTYPNRFKVPVKFWGSGAAFLGAKVDVRSETQYLAVRGPLTRDTLDLDNDTPLGDPAFLFPRLFPDLAPGENGPAVYIPHIRSCIPEEEKRAVLLLTLGVKSYLETWVTPAFNVMSFIQAALDPEDALVGSLHAFILRIAFGRRVALCLPEGVEISNEAKWLDTFAFLGIPGGIAENAVGNLAEAQTWWTQVGANVVVPDLQPLLDAFPYPILTDI